VTLAVGETRTYNTSYTLTQADLDGKGNSSGDGYIHNTATADSNETASKDSSAEVLLRYAPDLGITKTFNGVTGGNGNTDADAKDDVLNYAVAVTNKGNVTLTGVTVKDPLTGQDIKDVTLAVGETRTYNTSYTLTQADLDGKGNSSGDGYIHNTATADSNETESVKASETVPLVYAPAIDVKKYVSVDHGQTWSDANTAEAAPILVHAVADDLPLYKFVVTNTGNVTLNNVVLSDVDKSTATPAPVDLNGASSGNDLLIPSIAVGGTYEKILTTAPWHEGSNHDTATATLSANPAITDTDEAYCVITDILSDTSGTSYNFPNNLTEIQVKVGGKAFAIQSKTYMMWDFYTSDSTLAAIDTSPDSTSTEYTNNGTPLLQTSVAELWHSGNEAIYRVYVANETNSDVPLNNSDLIVKYKLILFNNTSSYKDLIDLINGDPLNANNNDMSNIGNAVKLDGFLYPINGTPGTTWTGTAATDKVWASPNTEGTAVNEAPVNYDGGDGNDVIYGRNNTGVETLSGGAGNDLLVGRAGVDSLVGGEGDDWLYGSLGNDTIKGDAGNDRLFGAYGHDDLYGGTGKDVFLTRVGDFDTVHDFQYNAADPNNNDMVYIWWKTRDVNPVDNPHNTVDHTPDRYTDADGVIHASYKQLDGTEFLNVAYDHRNGYVSVNGTAIMELWGLNAEGHETVHPDISLNLIGISNSGVDANHPNPGIFIT
jgi:uncharacterized repeat protein (TIGR01451 family)